MKKRSLFTCLAILCFCTTLSAQQKLVDTIYIKTYQEDLKARFFVSQQNGLMINFFFKVEWKLYGFEKHDFVLSYESPKKGGVNEWSIFIQDERSYLKSKFVYSLKKFTKALQTEEFRIPIANGKVRVIMLYGAKCSRKVEVYPVKVGTDLSSEG